MGLFHDTIQALGTTRNGERDAFTVVDETVGWARLLRVQGQVRELADLAGEDPLQGAADRYLTLRFPRSAFCSTNVYCTLAWDDFCQRRGRLSKRRITGVMTVSDWFIQPAPFGHQMMSLSFATRKIGDVSRRTIPGAGKHRGLVLNASSSCQLPLSKSGSFHDFSNNACSGP
jgi:hypothetical protein